MDVQDVIRADEKIMKRGIVTAFVTVALLLGTFVLCLFIGSGGLTFSESLDGLLNKSTWANNYVIRKIRLPRMLCAAMVGAALSVGGLAMQSLFKNPLASPSVLGLSSGASLGASLAIAYGTFSFLGGYSTTFTAFISCVITMGLVYFMAYSKHGTPTVMLLLSGMAIGAFFSGMTSLIQYFADDSTLANIVFWIMGSFNKCGWHAFWIGIVPIVVGIALIWYNCREMNMIALGETTAKNLGVNVRRTRFVLICGTCLLVAGSVSISGIIGFVGLIVPHIFRMFVGPNHVILVPLCITGGAVMLLVMDTVAKIAIVGELPVGVLTSLLGAPFFLYILRTRKRDIWG